MHKVEIELTEFAAHNTTQRHTQKTQNTYSGFVDASFDYVRVKVLRKKHLYRHGQVAISPHIYFAEGTRAQQILALLW